MSLSKDEFDKGIKPLDKGSLEYIILDFLKKKQVAYTLTEIAEGLGVLYQGDLAKSFLTYWGISMALENLRKNNKVISKEVKTDISGVSNTYYMAK